MPWQCQAKATTVRFLAVDPAVEPKESEFRNCKRPRNMARGMARKLDADFRVQIKKDRVYTCEKHVTLEDIKICK